MRIAIVAAVACLSTSSYAADKCSFNEFLGLTTNLDAVLHLPNIACADSGDGQHEICHRVIEPPPPPQWTCVRDDGSTYMWDHPAPPNLLLVVP